MKNERNPLRRTLVTYFVIIIALMSALSFSSISIMWQNYRATENMFNSVFYTTSLSLSLDETHQKLTNIINYQDEFLIPDFEMKLSTMITDVKNLDTTMLEFAKSADDMNAYYAFLKIQKGILSYGEKSRVLVARYRSGTERAAVYELLYELKDDVEDLKMKQASLLFRQSVYTQKFYKAFEQVIIRNTYGISILTISIIILAIILAFRFAGTISNPIHRLVIYTNEIGKGNFLKIEKSGRVNAEIEKLFSSIDSMSKRLKSLIAEIEKKADVERLLKEEEIKNLKNENLLHQTEMQMLQSQINPHFLFNTLNMINTLTQIEEAERTGKMIESLSNLLRYILQRDTKNTCLRDELEIIDDYMYIQLTRFGDRIKYTKQVEDSALDVHIPPVSLQPFVENAIIHGLEPKVGSGHLQLTACMIEGQDQKKLQITIKDDGVGIPSEVMDKIERMTDPRDTRHSMGIVNSVRRLEMISAENEVNIQSRPGEGTVIKIILRNSLTA